MQYRCGFCSCLCVPFPKAPGPSHRAKTTSNGCTDHGITGPANWPDLNPTENLCCIVNTSPASCFFNVVSSLASLFCHFASSLNIFLKMFYLEIINKTYMWVKRKISAITEKKPFVCSTFYSWLISSQVHHGMVTKQQWNSSFWDNGMFINNAPFEARTKAVCALEG